MNKRDLQYAITQNKAQIYELKQLIEEATDHQEKRRLQHRLKELQYLQLWHLGQT